MREWLFLLFGMSLWGSAAALGVWAVCALLRRAHAPARLLKLLWLAAAARFVCPFAVSISLPLPQNRALAAAAGAMEHRYAAARLAAAALAGGPAPVPAPAASPQTMGSFPIWQAAALLWAAGALFLAARSLAATLRLRRRVALACKTRDGAYTCPQVDAPFTLGFPRPRIYLPEDLTGPARQAVLLHEQAHARRGDTLLKPLCYLAACLHWWNPLAWFTFRQFCREMEAACDEAATQGFDLPARAAYCESLYRFAAGKACAASGALSFGSGRLKERIARVLRYQKPAALALAACTLAAGLTLCACMARPSFAAASGSGEASLPQETAGEVSVKTAEAPAEEPEDFADRLADLQGQIRSLNTQLDASAGQAQGDTPAQGTVRHKELAGRRSELLEELLALVAPACATDEFLCPVGYTYISRQQGRTHTGADLCAAYGSPVYAIAGGIVTTAEFDAAYGNYAVIQHGADPNGESWASLYAHLDTLLICVGDAVLPGQQIGTVGSTGNSTGNHLHLELLQSGAPVQPQEHLPLTNEAALAADASAAAAYGQALAAGLTGMEFTAPLESCRYLSCPFGFDGHKGVDFAADTGTPVYSAAAGVVQAAGFDTQMGNYVQLCHDAAPDGSACTTLYTHLDTLCVTAGQAVASGQEISTVGNTGNSTGSHLHLELRLNGTPANPLACIPCP